MPNTKLLGPLNFLVFQWLCIRMTVIFDTDSGRPVGWYWMKRVVPLTGWWSPFKYF